MHIESGIIEEKLLYNLKLVEEAMLQQEFHSYWTKIETYGALKVYICVQPLN